jgi:hypothetical protein
MNLFLVWINGLIFLTCAYGQANQYEANWFLIGSMVFSAAIITWIITEDA